MNGRRRGLSALVPAMMLLCAAGAAGASTHGGDATPTGLVMTHRMMLLVIQVGVILFAAKLGNILFARIGLPGALGELVSGMIIGPYLLGGLAFPGFADGLFPMHGGFPVSPELYGLGAIAAIALLFMAGLETDLGLLLQYSVAGGLVGLGGVLAAFLFGAGGMALLSGLLLDRPVGFLDPPALFMGIILSATSVGISARILSERRKLDSPEGVTILSAAVIDDVIGIILLAVVLGVTTSSTATGSVDWGHIALIGAKAVGVWLVATVIGLVAARRISFVLKLFGRRTSVAVLALALALVLAGLFEEAGLAMIIGAYVMGLSLSRSDISHMVREKLHPIHELLVPIFFSVMGMRIDLGALGSPAVMLFGLAYAVAALLSKLLGCGGMALLAKFNVRGALRVGFGMAPRCEVALIIASLGLSAHVLDGDLFSAVVFMVLINSVVAPAMLGQLFRGEAPGTRKELPARQEDRREVSFTFPSRAMTEFLLSRLIGVFDQEGFFVHLLRSEPRLYQLRKDATVMDLRCEGTELSFHAGQADVPLINTAMYEAVAELERAIRGLKHPMDANSIASRVQEHRPEARGLLDLRQYLAPGLIEPDLVGRTKAEVIDELLGLLVRQGKLDDVEAARRAVWRREESMSTGLQHGVAIPHARCDAVDRLVCSVGIHRDGVDFDSMDGEPGRIVILTLSPEAKPAPHVQFMSTVSQILNPAGRQHILECATAAEIYQAFVSGPRPVRPRSATGTSFRLGEYLRPETIATELAGTTPEAVITELVDLAAAGGVEFDVASARRAVLAREAQMPTGMQDGIAIPHGRTDAVDRLVCAFGVQREGVDFGGVDGEPARFFVLALTPSNGGDPYLQFTAAVMGALDAEGRRSVLAATTPQQIHAVLTRADWS